MILQAGEQQPEARALHESRGWTPIPVYEPYAETMLHAPDASRRFCYDAWRHYITGSLAQRITTGRGTMRTHEEDVEAVRQHAEARH